MSMAVTVSLVYLPRRQKVKQYLRAWISHYSVSPGVKGSCFAFLPYTAKKKFRKFEANIPRKGISGPQSQFPHSCVCERIKYSHDGAAVSAGGNMWTDPRNI
jgi:hypothetical protein